MSKRPHESAELLDQLKLACNDPLQVRGILESQNIDAIADLVIRLLAVTDCDATNHAKHQKKAHNRPRMLNELFVEVMLFMDRDSLDSMQLACRFMLAYIREHEPTELALRRISKLNLGKVYSQRVFGEEENWLPIMRLSRHNIDHQKKRIFNCVHDLLPYLRMAYCETVDVTLEIMQSADDSHYDAACGMLLDGLKSRETHVDSLTVRSDFGTVNLLNRTINAFKSVRKVTMTTVADEVNEPEAFNEAFFASLAHRGICCFRAELDCNDRRGTIWEIDAANALAYVFAEPTNGVSRELSGIECMIEKDFLELVRKKAGEMDSRHVVDLQATIQLRDLDAMGFEKYENGERRWVVNDLDNGLTLEIEENIILPYFDDRTVHIHVYSST